MYWKINFNWKIKKLEKIESFKNIKIQRKAWNSSVKAISSFFWKEEEALFMIVIKSEREIQKIKEAGHIVFLALQAIENAICPGITTE